MKIIKAKRSGRNQVQVLLEDDQKITLAYEVFLRNQLKLNQEITDETLLLLKDEDQKYQVKQSALNFLSRRHHSRNEIQTKLRQKKFEPQLIEQTLDELQQNDYVDDFLFAKIFTDEKLKLKNWGKNKIKSELIKRGITAKIISDVIEEKFNGEIEIDAGLEIARKKLKKLFNRNIDSKKLQTSIYSFLIARGYDYESCKQIVGRLIKEKELTDF